jgi:hypothetical protein
MNALSDNQTYFHNDLVQWFVVSRTACQTQTESVTLHTATDEVAKGQ